eukprot:1653752-Rhodomonas_salina.1
MAQGEGLRQRSRSAAEGTPPTGIHRSCDEKARANPDPKAAWTQESGIVSGDAEVGGQLLSVLYEHAEMKASLLESAPEDLLQGPERHAL